MSPEDYEGVVLRAFGWAAGGAPIRELAEGYRRLSEAILAEEEGGAPTGTLQPGGDPTGVAAAWALVFGFRTWWVATQLLAAHGVGERLAEVGSGWGPFGLAAAQRGASVELVDLARDRLAWAPRIYSAAGCESPRLTEKDAREWSPQGAEAIALPFSFGELERSRGEGSLDATLLAWLARLPSGGRIFLVEPGTHVSSRRLMALRDRMHGAATIAGPCPARARCAMASTPKDWCHFTWNTPTGSVTRQVLEAAGRHWRELHFSHLVLAPLGARVEATPARVLDVQARAKGKVELTMCTPDGLERVVALTRHRAAAERLSSIDSGAVVTPSPDLLERRGDGLRLEDPRGIELLRGL